MIGGLLDIVILGGAKMPIYSEENAGCDLFAADMWYNETSQQLNVSFGVKIKVPDHCVGLIFPRSSIKAHSYRLANCVGVIDPSYTGVWKAVFDKRHFGDGKKFEVGHRVAQFVIVPRFVVQGFNQVKELSETSRGEGGFGSTGND